MGPISVALALADAVPALVGLLKGPQASETAAKVIDAAKAITGHAYPEDAVAAVQADPAKLAELRATVMQLDLEYTKAQLADVASARAMQSTALQQQDTFSKRFAYYFAAGWSAFAVVFFFAATFCKIPPENLRIVDTILGFVLGTAIASIFNWLYGTTVRSATKDDTIKQLVSGGKNVS